MCCLCFNADGKSYKVGWKGLSITLGDDNPLTLLRYIRPRNELFYCVLPVDVRHIDQNGYTYIPHYIGLWCILDEHRKVQNFAFFGKNHGYHNAVFDPNILLYIGDHLSFREKLTENIKFLSSFDKWREIWEIGIREI